MTQIAGRRQNVTSINASLEDGDCSAERVPALWYQEDDDYYTESGFLDRFWLPLSIGVIAGWGALSFVLVDLFGWIVLAAIGAIVAVGAVSSVVLIRSGEGGRIDNIVPAHTEHSEEQQQLSNAA